MSEQSFLLRPRAPVSSTPAGSTSAGRRLRSVALAATIALSAGIVGGSSAAAAAAAAPPGDCPTVLPTDQLDIGGTGRGWTVVQGTTRVPFRVEFVGVLQDAIAPGKDLIIAQVSDLPGYDFIARSHGIWAGISGSPVYDGGKLVGSVSYSLNVGEAFIAGLTPAEDITEILGYPSSAPAQRDLGARHIPVPAAMRASLAKRAGVRPDQVSTFDRLAVPLAVSGLSKRGRDRLQADFDKLGMAVVVTPGSAVEAPHGGFGTAKAGGNFAALLSYGDLTAGGIGTTTYVCGDQALAFGHPFGFSGKSGLAAYDASAIAIIPGIFGSYKLANLTVPLGTVDQDRLSAIRAHLGVAPAVVPITSHVTSLELGTSRDGETWATDQRFVPVITVFHLLSNLDRVIDRVGAGTAGVHWTVTGHVVGGDSFTLVRGDRYASQGDISFAPLDDIYNDLSAIAFNQFSDVVIDSVDLRARISTDYAPYTVQSAKISKNGGPFKPRDQLTVHPGDELRIRTKLVRYHGDTRTVEQTLVVPAKTSGSGLLLIGTAFDDIGRPSTGAQDFDELLASLASQPRNDDLRARIVMFGPTREEQIVSVQQRLDGVIGGGIIVSVTAP